MYPPLVQTLVVSTKAGRLSLRTGDMLMGSWTVSDGEIILAELRSDHPPAQYCSSAAVCGSGIGLPVISSASIV